MIRQFGFLSCAVQIFRFKQVMGSGVLVGREECTLR